MLVSLQPLAKSAWHIAAAVDAHTVTQLWSLATVFTRHQSLRLSRNR
jgi:hypothetical protein